MEQKENQRIRLTKTLLTDALLKMLQEQPMLNRIVSVWPERVARSISMKVAGSSASSGFCRKRSTVRTPLTSRFCRR